MISNTARIFLRHVSCAAVSGSGLWALSKFRLVSRLIIILSSCCNPQEREEKADANSHHSSSSKCIHSSIHLRVDTNCILFLWRSFSEHQRIVIVGTSSCSNSNPSTVIVMVSTRDNNEYRWQDSPQVIGALEVQSEPDFEPKEDLKSRCVPERENDFDGIQAVWIAMKLQDEFVQACEGIPMVTYCCGLIPDPDGSIKEFARVLERGWIKSVNRRLAKREEKFKIDAFVWNWVNATGKAETNILLIRFLEKSETKKTKSSLRSRSLSSGRSRSLSPGPAGLQPPVGPP
jgi:hypothetical protein